METGWVTEATGPGILTEECVNLLSNKSRPKLVNANTDKLQRGGIIVNTFSKSSREEKYPRALRFLLQHFESNEIQTQLKLIHSFKDHQIPNCLSH